MVGLAVAAVAAVAVAGSAWAPWERSDAPGPANSGGDAIDPASLAAREWAPDQLAVTTGGLLALTDRDDPGRLDGTGIIAQRVLAGGENSLFVLGDRDHVFSLSILNDGTLDRSDDVTGAPVVAVWADDFLSLAYAERPDGPVMINRPGADGVKTLALPVEYPSSPP